MGRHRTPRDPAVPTEAYLTRHMPTALLDRVRRQARQLDTTLEDAVALTLEIGVAVLERKRRRT